MKKFGIKNVVFIAAIVVVSVLLTVGSFGLGGSNVGTKSSMTLSGATRESEINDNTQTQADADENIDNTGDFYVSGGKYGTAAEGGDYHFEPDVWLETSHGNLKIHPQSASTKITISQWDPSKSTNDHIEIESAANIVIAQLNIETYLKGEAPIKITDDADFNVTIELYKTNILKSAGDVQTAGVRTNAGLQKNVSYEKMKKCGLLTIKDSGEGNGELYAYGNDSFPSRLVPLFGTGAGIGGSYGWNTANINIESGTIHAKGGIGAAGIGGGYQNHITYKGGNAYGISITGGSVEAEGGGGDYTGWAGFISDLAGLITGSGAGIGSGCGGDAENITISNATVNAKGHKNTMIIESGGGGAGIGGGEAGSASDITITNNSHVTAEGGDGAAGIGSGQGNYTIASGIRIKDSTVTATGGPDYTAKVSYSRYIEKWVQDDKTKEWHKEWKKESTDVQITASGAGIGSGVGGGASGITILGKSTIKATGGGSAAGIGSGALGDANSITINVNDNCTVEANGTYGNALGFMYPASGAGIGGGANGKATNITISGGNIIAKADRRGAGIGSGFDSPAENITISGGNVTATGGEAAAGIGGGDNADASYITISGGTVTAYGGEDGAGIGGGDDKSGFGIKITGGNVTAIGGKNGAGIGGGSYGNGGEDKEGCAIAISGGSVTANGGECGAGIGGGTYASGNNIQLSGGIVTATGGSKGAGIGGGYEKDGTDIKITGGVVKVQAGNSSASGIGGGFKGQGKNNSIDGDTVVLASGEYGLALDGFDGRFNRGIVFQRLAKDKSWETGNMYGSNVAVTETVELPTDFTVSAGKTLEVRNGATLKINGTVNNEAGGNVIINENSTLSIGENNTQFNNKGRLENRGTLNVNGVDDSNHATVTNIGTIQNNGRLSVNGYLYNNVVGYNKDDPKGVITGEDTITCGGAGKIYTALELDPQGGILPDDQRYTSKIYKTKDGVSHYGESPNIALPIPGENAEQFNGWFTEVDGTGDKIEDTTPVLLNQHELCADWEIDDVPFDVYEAEKGGEYRFDITDKILQIYPVDNDSIIIKNKPEYPVTDWRIVVEHKDKYEDGETALIILDGVNINAAAGPAIEILRDANFHVNILLADDSTNILKTQEKICAALEKESDQKEGTLSIGVPDGGKGNGKLEAVGGENGAGIGGGWRHGGSNITINGGIITATGYSGIGGGDASVKKSKNNSINGNAVVFATSYLSIIDPCQGLSVSRGILFNRRGSSGSWSGEMQGEINLADNLELPSDLTIPEDGTLRINEGLNVTINSGITMRNDGILIGDENVIFKDTGKLDTLVKYDGQGGIVSKDSEYKTYKDKDGYKKYGEIPDISSSRTEFLGWYTSLSGGMPVDSKTEVELNHHVLYAMWELPFIVKGGTQGIDYNQNVDDGVLEILTDKPLTIKNKTSNTSMDWQIGVKNLPSNKTANITLNGVNIDTGFGPAFWIEDEAEFSVNITLAEGSNNILKSSANGNAGLQKNSTKDSCGKLTITGAGSLEATGAWNGAGIGGGGNWWTYNITISGGNIKATGGDYGAGIGGGAGGSAYNINISGGTVESYGGLLAAGIGGGYAGYGCNINITGGIVTATGKDGGAGIGGGDNGIGSNNKLDGNTIIVASGGDYYGSKKALEGFEKGLLKGIAFTPQRYKDALDGNVYGDINLSQDFTFPENALTLTINDNASLHLQKAIVTQYYEYNSIVNNGTLTINSQASIKGGTVTNNAKMEINWRGSVLSDTINNNGTLTIDGPESTLGGTVNNNATMTANGEMAITTGTVNNKGTINISGDGSIQSGDVNNDGTLTVGGQLSIKDGDVNNNSKATMKVDGGLSIQSGAVNNEANMTIGGQSSVQNVNNNNGTMTVNGPMSVANGDVNNKATMTVGGGLSITQSGNVNNDSALTISDQLSIKDGDVNNNNNSTMKVDGGLSIQSGTVKNEANMTIGGQTSVQNVNNNNGTMTVNGPMSVTNGDVNNKATMAVGGGLFITQSGNVNNDSNLTISGQLSIQDGDVNNNSDSTMKVDGGLSIQSGTVKNEANMTIGGQTSVQNVNNNNGTMTVNGPMSVANGDVYNNATIIFGNGSNLTISGTLQNDEKGNITISGTIHCEGEGKVVTKVNYNPQGGRVDPASEYITYQTGDTVQAYKDLPTPMIIGTADFEGWITEDGINVSQAETPVLLNEHILYADWENVPFLVKGATQDEGDYKYNFGTKTMQICDNHSMLITNKTPTASTDWSVEVTGEVEGTLDITMSDININTSNGPAMKIDDDAICNVNVYLEDGSDNKLVSTSNGSAGLQKDSENGELIITALRGSKGTGILRAGGGKGAAGIGGGDGQSASNIRIEDGIVLATGGQNAAGIGGGNGGTGSNIGIYDGVVMAAGNGGGSGIGSGNGEESNQSENNKLDGNVVVFASGGSTSKGALDGFGEEGINRGLVFTRLSDDEDTPWSKATLYGETVALTEDTTIPIDVVIGENQTLKIDSGVTLTVPAGVTLQNDGNLEIDGASSIQCLAAEDGKSSGAVVTRLNYNAQGGSFDRTYDYQIYQDQNGAVGKCYQNLPQPMENSRYHGWNTKPDGTGVYLTGEVPVNLNLHDVYADYDYSVIFRAYNDQEDSTQTLKYGSKVENPGNPSRKGHTFDSWYKDKDYKEKWNFDEDTISGDTVIYAKWIINQYRVTFDTNGGSAVDSQTLDYNSTIGKPETSKKGYTLDGWYKDSDFKDAWSFENDRIEDDMTLYAKWNINQYTITFDVCGGSAVESQTITYNETANRPVDPTRQNYLFRGWYKDKDYKETWNFASDKVEGDTTLYAKWDRLYNISVTNTKNGNVDVVSSSTKGETITFQLIPNKGYQIGSRPIVQTNNSYLNVTSLSNNSYSFEMPGSDVSISADFELIPVPNLDPSSGLSQDGSINSNNTTTDNGNNSGKININDNSEYADSGKNDGENENGNRSGFASKGLFAGGIVAVTCVGAAGAGGAVILKRKKNSK